MTATTKTTMFRMYRVPFTRKKPLKVSATRQTIADGSGIDFRGGFVCGHYRFPEETGGCVSHSKGLEILVIWVLSRFKILDWVPVPQFSATATNCGFLLVPILIVEARLLHPELEDMTLGLIIDVGVRIFCSFLEQRMSGANGS